MLRDVYVERIACRGTCRVLGARGECARLVRARGAQSLATSLRADAARTAAVLGLFSMVTANIVQLRGGALVHERRSDELVQGDADTEKHDTVGKT